MNKTPSYLLVLVAALVVMIWSHWQLNHSKNDASDITSSETLPKPEMVQLVSLGYDRFLADIYWLGLIQYVGDPRNGFNHFPESYKYVDLITTLDPYFQSPYWFGCWAIGYWQQRPDLADKIIQRGISYHPKDWYMPFMGGVNQYLFAHDTKRAAAYYRKAAQYKDAPEYLTRQAAILDSPIPEYEKRIRSLWNLYSSAKDENLKKSAETQLLTVLYKMYKEAPTAVLRKGVKDQLLKLGVDESELD